MANRPDGMIEYSQLAMRAACAILLEGDQARADAYFDCAATLREAIGQ